MPDAPPPSAAALTDLDPERVRFARERSLIAALESTAGFTAYRKSILPSDPAKVRRRLLGDALRLTESMAPAAYHQAAEAQRVLGVDGVIELYQSSGQENAALHLVRTPILLEIQGRLLSLLDAGAGAALFGHELGHYLAHGPWTELGASSFVGVALAQQGLLPAAELGLARHLSVSREITADRFALLACQDLDAALRLEMVATTGLSGDALTWDTQAYLQQCRDVMQTSIAAGEAALMSTHPEHSLRAWATWLFWESDVFAALTGKGPGLRPLSEVDAMIEQALGSPTGDGHSFDVREEPPPFLLECALASAVLVAEADGEVAPEELAAIEDAFARTVPGWSEFLDPDVALERFYETGGLVRAGGADLARRLFLLLSHVMGADDVIDPREIQMVLSIGEALGFSAEFRQWLEPAVVAAGGTVDVDLEQAPAMPLPARKGEIQAALVAFCDLVLRQVHTKISPRRLMRIAGSESDDAAARQRVAGLLIARAIDCKPSLTDCPADALMSLTAQRPTPAAATVRQPLDTNRQSVIAGLSRLRDELISGDGRSPSVRLRRPRRGRVFDLFRLDAVRNGAAERALTLLRSGKAATLVTAADAGRHDAAQQCVEDLRHLDRANTDRFEETGANDLYLGYPTLIGNVSPRGSTEPGYGVRAPLVLYPVVLQRDGRGTRGFSLSPHADEPPIVNQSLLRVLFNKADLALPDELLNALDTIAADEGQDTSTLIAKLNEVGLPLRAETTTLGAYAPRDDDLDGKSGLLALEECALLGIFPQSSSDLLQDYDALLNELADSAQPLESVLAAAAGLLPPDLQAADQPLEAPTPGWPVLDADPSQREVLAACMHNRVTVIDGPPGTGKSQVIVNLVADALRRGERVAVVAEKRAALDVVYQRLDTMGLGDAAAVVHDVRDDRKGLFARIGERLGRHQARKANDTRLAILRAEHETAEQTLERRRSLLAHTTPSVALSVGQLMALRGAGEAIEPPAGLVDLDRASLGALLEFAERLHPYADLWGPASWWRSRSTTPRPGLHEQDDAGVANLLGQLDAALQVATRTEDVLSAQAVEPTQLDAARPGLAALQHAIEAVSSGDTATVLAATLATPQVDVDSVGQQWSEHATALATWHSPAGLAIDDELARNASVLHSYAGRFTRFFSLTWWRTRGAVRQALVRTWPEQAGAALTPALLSQIRARIDAARTWQATQGLFDGLGIGQLAPRSADEAPARLEQLRTCRALGQALAAAQPALAPLGLALAADTDATTALSTLQPVLAHRQAQVVALDERRAAIAPVLAQFSWLTDAGPQAIADALDHLRRDASRLRESDGWWAKLDATHTIGRAALDAVAVQCADTDATGWREAVTRGWAAAQLEALRNVVPQIDSLGTTAEAQTVTRAAQAMRKLDGEIRQLEVEMIAARLDTAELLHVPDAKYRARRTPEQKLKEQLTKEVGKSRHRMPLRQFVRTFSGEGLLDVVPCWLVSPETMAVLFPREPLFDLVVFDEASQCTVESGFPVALRAKRVVVAGDDKQMPPTSFFDSDVSSTDDEDLAPEELQARDAFAAESLLVLARNRCPHAGLKWHYRCRSEELIAYSNHSMYDGDLLTIPSTAGPSAPSALRWVEIDDGDYDAGLNRPEATRVVDLLAELLARSPRPTVGIVTFNLKQRQTILDTIESRAADDPSFSELWTQARGVEALDERPFVKNLESVQGDERDIIVFSLGHAPVERTRKGGKSERYVPARFGPLGLRGGERRLNVAISRAKRECYVVSSFDPRLLHVGQSRHSGPRLFKGYLEFARFKSGGHHQRADRVLDEVRGTPRDDLTTQTQRVIDGHLPLAAQIAYALEEHGLRCELGVGSSRFQIPLAVAAKGDETTFSLAVLTDEGGRGVSAFDQFVHQPLVLGLRGWQVMHVDAAAWLRRRSEIVQQIVNSVGSTVDAALR